MTELNSEQTKHVSGGIALLAPVAVALADTGGWAALGSAGTAGFYLGQWMLSFVGSNDEDTVNYNYF